MLQYWSLLACPLVLFLTIWDKDARRWAGAISLAVGAGWYAYWINVIQLYPLISLALCVFTLRWFLAEPKPWKSGVHALAVVMLVLDGYLFLVDVIGGYVGEEYATLCSTGLIAQLFLIGHKGAINAWRSLLGGGLVRVYRPASHVSRSGRREA